MKIFQTNKNNNFFFINPKHKILKTNMYQLSNVKYIEKSKIHVYDSYY